MTISHEAIYSGSMARGQKGFRIGGRMTDGYANMMDKQIMFKIPRGSMKQIITWLAADLSELPSASSEYYQLLEAAKKLRELADEMETEAKDITPLLQRGR